MLFDDCGIPIEKKKRERERKEEKKNKQKRLFDRET